MPIAIPAGYLVLVLHRILTAVRWRWYLALARLAGAPRRLPGPRAGVALTFDDGPDPESTPRVLDVLAAEGVRATFFCVGARARQHPELVHRILAEGHALGSHSDSHAVTGLPAAATMQDYATGRGAVEAVAGRPVTLFRPPHGRLDLRTAWALRRSGLRTRLWTVDPGDYVPGTTAEIVVRTVGSAGEGDVVLLHDVLEEAPVGAPSRDVLVTALPEAIRALRRRGLSFAPLA
jgi:peptidoglycan/xylan/chitin deacetylase (PgdA/CDA1 family)